MPQAAPCIFPPTTPDARVRLRRILSPAGAAAALAVLLMAPAPALAGSRPAQACKPLAGLPGPHGLWLGHFTGGRIGAGPFGEIVEWRDDYACFTSAADCAAWRRGLRAVYRDVEGWGTCLALRGGGDYAPVARVTKRTVVKARY